MISVGIDVGSITAKAAVVKDGRVVFHKLILTGYNARIASKTVFDATIKESGVDPAAVDTVISTGYGRNSVANADQTLTEITCHAAGARFLNPAVRSVIDIGGQDSKVIALNESGSVNDFAMNDKCAAGTGRFLEVMAKALDVDLNCFGQLSAKSNHPSKISSLCTVFAESEVISLIVQGEKRENIAAGIHASIAARVAAMAGRTDLMPPIMMTGGVAKNNGVVQALEKKIGHAIEVLPQSQVVGAIGAAILAQRASGKVLGA